ncbi:hypothetical protein [Amycolatopsis sp. CA-230715]|uniref:hypothetical protein n=1 Tax=Amycolatopsis sp. CA-230715 TaxID=2745196 RepID=UPI001C039F54|nr:hypothetical protein [Amycolatopsis sp. CA-230715]QWF77399.1 hypothetical protein HUW46_00791 [Amycolatopsis sp. CA-230715]
MTALKPVIRLLYANLGLSILLAALTFAFQREILDYQVMSMPGIPHGTAAEIADSRASLESVLWIRPVSVLVIAIVYMRLATRLHLGKRSTYLRVLVIAVAGFAGLVYLVASAQFPLWMRGIQVVQAIVLLGLLVAVLRPEVRSHFAKKVPAGA